RFIFRVRLPLIYGRSRTFYLTAARPFRRSRVRAIAILLGGALAAVLAPSDAQSVARLAIFAACYALVTQLNRVLREFLQGGRTGVITWFRSSWRPALSAEIAPLPVAALGAAIYTGVGTVYFALAGACFLAAIL